MGLWASEALNTVLWTSWDAFEWLGPLRRAVQEAVHAARTRKSPGNLTPLSLYLGRNGADERLINPHIDKISFERFFRTWIRAELLATLGPLVYVATSLPDPLAGVALGQLEAAYHAVQVKKRPGDPEIFAAWPSHLAFSLTNIDYDEPASVRDFQRLIALLSSRPDDLEAFLIALAHHLARHLKEIRQLVSDKGEPAPDESISMEGVLADLVRHRTQNGLDYVLKPLILLELRRIYNRRSKNPGLRLLSALFDLQAADIETTFHGPPYLLITGKVSDILDRVQKRAVATAIPVYPPAYIRVIHDWLCWLDKARMELHRHFKAVPAFGFSRNDGYSPLSRVGLLASEELGCVPYLGNANGSGRRVGHFRSAGFAGGRRRGFGHAQRNGTFCAQNPPDQSSSGWRITNS